MTNQEFAQLLALRHEMSGVEFKGPGTRSDRPFFAQIVRVMLGMANRRDGGTVVIGVEDVGTTLSPVGLTDEQGITWRYDDVADGISAYADPNVSFDLEIKLHESKQYVVLEISEFEDIPVLCKRSYQSILRNGACYVRTRRKPETSEIPAQAEMRDLLDLATEKAFRKFIAQAQRAGMNSFGTPQPDDEDLFDQQLGDMR